MVRKTRKSQPTTTAQRCPEPQSKRQKTRHLAVGDHSVGHPTLQLYYPRTCSLRQYLLSDLPKSAKRRRRRFLNVGGNVLADESTQQSIESSWAAKSVNGLKLRPEDLACVREVLDSTIVCVRANPIRSAENLAKDCEALSQHVRLTADSELGASNVSISELVDHAVKVLFDRIHPHCLRPPHLLCYGIQRAQPTYAEKSERAMAGTGLVIRSSNANSNTLKGLDWEIILALLGNGGDKIILDMLLNCALFVPVTSDLGHLNQISGKLSQIAAVISLINEGMPLSELEPLKLAQQKSTIPSGLNEATSKPLAAIRFVRSRMYHARPALNAKGNVAFGLRHIHALKRYSDHSNLNQTVHLMKYIFPRQFGLHNVFTSRVDPMETTQVFKDYTLREHEISLQEESLRLKTKRPQNIENRIPKRLRGETLRLVQELQKRSSRCSFEMLLRYYCPVPKRDSVMLSSSQKVNGRSNKRVKIRPTSAQEIHDTARTARSLESDPSLHALEDDGKDRQLAYSSPSITDMANSHAEISAFCRSVMSKLIPNKFWGSSYEGENKREIMKSVDRFIALRRFESLSLHAVFQHIKIAVVPWLVPPQCHGQKTSISDFQKRKDIFLEFVYYTFDSILIPLLRSNFHVTESNVHQNKLLYFRHDVWRELTEPAISRLKLSLYEELPAVQANQILDSRHLGFNQVRMLPKASGMRPIMNLRRRTTKLYKGRIALGKSVNSIITPVFKMLDLERKKHPELMGSSLFSVGDMQRHLEEYNCRLIEKGLQSRRLYFAKADAVSCFDTIPQQAVISLIESMIQESECQIARHAEIRHDTLHYYRRDEPPMVKPCRKFISTARAANDSANITDVIKEERVGHQHDTVFVETGPPQRQTTKSLLQLLREHIQQNITKIGKKFYRQRAGIPQGSVLSSLLCNFFYSQMEQEHLDFVRNEESLLLRLVDDFLLITANKAIATEFVRVMHAGMAEYGIKVNVAKSLVNFPVNVHGFAVPHLPGNSMAFPYCGNLINMKTLEIAKDRDRRKKTTLSDTLTVEHSKTPGRTFYRKALNAFKIQTMKMLVDTTFNTPMTVLGTIYQNFAETAMKVFRYAKCMPSHGQPNLDLTIGTIRDLISLAFILIRAKHQNHGASKGEKVKCAVSKRQVAWLAGMAFHRVLSRKQTRYRDAIAWLETTVCDGRKFSEKEASKLSRIVDEGDDIFHGYKY